MKKLTEIREHEKLSKEEFAKKIDVSVDELERLEASEESLPPEIIKKISDTFGYRISALTQQNLDDVRPQLFTPITCPHCKSREIAFVSEYHVSIVDRIIEILLLIAFIPLAIISISKITTGEAAGTPALLLVIVIVLYIIVRSNLQITESKTHVQCICKDCGHLWLIN